MIVEHKTLWENSETVAYDLYLQENSVEIEADRSYPAMVICPGGGFLRISERNKEPVALHFLARGYQVIVLNYSTRSTGTGRYPKPLMDLAKMIATVRENAAEWHIDSDQVAIMGFSSGGTLCASLSTQWQEEFLSQELQLPSERFRPNAVVLCYALLDYLQERPSIDDAAADVYSPSIGMRRKDYMKISYEAAIGSYASEDQYRRVSPYYHVTEQVPPTFLWHTSRDELVGAAQSMRYALRLAEEGVPYELHVFERGAHGLSLAKEATAGVPELIDADAADWTELAERFLKRHLNK